MFDDQPRLYEVLAREGTEAIREQMRKEFESALRQVYPFRMGPAFDFAIQRAYAAGVADGFRQGVERATEAQADESERFDGV